jgi:hypothetical protein
MAKTPALFPYALTLFRQGGTVAPPADGPAPALPTVDMISDGWSACAALRSWESSASLVPPGMTRIIFGFFPPNHGGALARVAFDFPADETAQVCRGPSVTGRTIADFRHLPASPARPEFY